MSPLHSLSQITQMINTNKPETLQLEYHPELATTLFAPISAMPWSMLLSSASADHPDSRFDIIVANPVATLLTKGQQTAYSDGNVTTTSDDCPFQLLQQHLDKLVTKYESDELYPFTGGALGYFSYDLGRRVEQIPEIAENDIDTAQMAVGIYQWAVIIDHKEKRATVVGEQVEKHHLWLQAQKEQASSPFSLVSEFCSNMSKQSYQAKFDKIQDYLLSGDCYQINLAQRFSAEYSGSEWDAFMRLQSHNKAPFSAFIRLDDCAILSVSPERFIQLKQGEIETKPIKGTRPRSNNPEQDLANAVELTNTEKDQAENLMIVDLLRNDIGRVAKPGTVQVPKLFDVESFPAVHHLVSTVTAELDKGYSATQLLKACFPGGSITGAPKIRAMEIIEELEPHRRNVYCGSIGYLSSCGRMDTSITIRTLITRNNRIYAWAGGGIVADSQCDAEYQETLDKLSKILPVLEN